MTGEDFFCRAFGGNPEEFMTILHMPERILMYRKHEPQAEEKDWLQKFKSLTVSERGELVTILATNRTKATLQKAYAGLTSSIVKEILAYYMPEPASAPLFAMLEGAAS